ncbi:MAG: LysM peptidoglycan-binding domain-containing protein [Firmicutes bacterium]|mgnify:CR=1 FL=1|nr:LysM peptidoglycan-binding domain-containing protein [Bacillota bacterium]
MGRKALKEGKIELLTAKLDFASLVGETVLRFFLTKDLLFQEEPARDKDRRPLPLGDLAAWVSLMEVNIAEKNKVVVQGKVEGKAVFYSTAGPKEVGWGADEFSKEADVPGALPGMTVNGHGRIFFLDDSREPLEEEGKWLYQLQIGIEILLTVSDPQQLEIGVGAKNILPEQVVRGVISAEELVGEKSVPLTLTSELDFPEQLDYIKTLSCSLADYSYEKEKEGLLFKGELVTVIYFIAGKERGFQESRQTFSQQIPFPLKKGAEVVFFPQVEYAAHDLLGKKARQRVYVDIYLRATRLVQQEVLTDIREGEVKKEYLMLPKPAGIAREPLELMQRLAFPFPREITAGPCRLIKLEADVQENRVVVSGILEKTIYYIPAPEREQAGEEEEQWPLAIKMEEDFNRSLQLPGLEPGSSVIVYFSPGRTEFAAVEAATLQVTHAYLEAKAWETNEYSVVVPFRVPPETSLVIYAVHPGDTLLKIARLYGVKTSTIVRANNLSDEATPPAGSKLMIPLFYEGNNE